MTRILLSFVVALLLVTVAIPSVATAESITTEELELLLDTDTPQAEIIRMVRNAESVRVSPDDLAGLRRRGASDELIEAIRERLTEFTLDTVLQMLAADESEDAILDRILDEGRRFALSVEDKLQLNRAGASVQVLKALEGQYVIEGYRTYTDPLGMVSIQHPANWRDYHWYTADGVKVLLSPETDVPGPNQFTTGVQIQLSFLHPGHRLRRPDADLYSEHLNSLDSWLLINREYKPSLVGDPQRTKVAGRPAVKQVFDMTMPGNHACRELMVSTVADDVHYFVEMVAPRGEYGELASTFRRIARTIRPFPDRRDITRRREPLRMNDVVERYREAVVLIKVDFGERGVGYGTGFFVREDGFILTNHHVVSMQDDYSLVPRSIEIIWDNQIESDRPGEARRTLRVDLVDKVRIESPLVDIALLKAPPRDEPYVTLPLVPVTSGLVKRGDTVVAMGFPLPETFLQNMVSTQGSISNLIPIDKPFSEGAAQREYNYALLDITINPGNSGGPAISADTGAVIGLNTQVPHARTWGDVERLDYANICLIDYAIYHFPQIRWYPRERPMTAVEHLELGAMLLSASNRRAAGVELERALEYQTQLRPAQRARLYHQLYVHRATTGRSDEAMELLDQALGADPDYTPAIVDRAYEYAARKQLDRAMRLADQLVEQAPEDWIGHYHRAEVNFRAARYEDALFGVVEALRLGGDYDPAVHRLRGRVLYELEKFDEGRDAFRIALEVDARDHEAMLALADYHHRTGNDDAALVEYHRVIDQMPGEARVQEVVGRFEVTLGTRRAEGLEHMVRAVLIAEEQGDLPPPLLLRDAGQAALDVRGQEVVSVFLAKRLHQYWPAWRGWAHNLLGRFHTAVGNAHLARAHHLAADQVGGPGRGQGNAIPRGPLAFKELVALIQLGYTPGMMIDTMAQTSIGFQLLTKEAIQTLSQSGMNNWQVNVLGLWYDRDQVRGTGELGGAVSVEYESKVFVDHERGPWMVIKLTNNGQVPLTGLQLRKTYWDEGQKTLLWESTGELVTNRPSLQPGETRRIKLWLNRWSTIRAAGVDPATIHQYGVEVIAACNATFLSSISLEGGITDAGYEIKVGNRSAFTVRQVRLCCEFLDANGKPVLNAAGKPVRDTRVFSVELAPGTQRQVVVPEWRDGSVARRLGGQTAAASLSITVSDGLVEFAGR